MTTLKSRRFLTLAVMLALLLLTTPRASDVPLPELPPAAEVIGSAAFPALVCAGCIGGGVLIAMGGWGSVLVAAARPGSTLAVLGCVGICHRAVMR